MKKAFFLLLSICALQTMFAQSIKIANVAKIECMPLEFSYLGEFRMPDNSIEIRWKVIGHIKNTGTATFHSPGSKLALSVRTYNDPNIPYQGVSTIFDTLDPGEIKYLVLEVKYKKGQPKPEMRMSLYNGNAIRCYQDAFVPDWVPK